MRNKQQTKIQPPGRIKARNKKNALKIHWFTFNTMKLRNVVRLQK